MLRLAGLVAAAQVWLATPGFSQSQVYDAAPPRGSAYVRLVNGLPGEVSARPDFLPQQRLGTGVAERAMPFTVVENVANRQLRLEFQEGQRRGTATFRAEAGSFTTVLLHATADGNITATAITDAADFNRARSRLAFYNGLPDCPAAALTLLPSGPAVFEDVPSLQTRSRSVTPVEAQVRASCGTRNAAPVALQGLEAGGMYSVWLIGAGTNIGAFVTRDTTARYRP
ncbi:ABC transporter permease [Roseococcus sp. YIM B11640]|uniref:ABC transporter permease n=1 Tax=Roseococcus sp. YIM B11640 TaxID=3133973 RepID=UPI003C7EC317